MAEEASSVSRIMAQVMTTLQVSGSRGLGSTISRSWWFFFFRVRGGGRGGGKVLCLQSAYRVFSWVENTRVLANYDNNLTSCFRDRCDEELQFCP